MDSTYQTPRAFLNSITFSDRTQVHLSNNQILVIVGANNSGKSASLTEINKISMFEQLPLEKNKVVKNAEFTKIGSVDDLKRFIWEHTFTKPENGDIRQINVYYEDNNNMQTRQLGTDQIFFSWENASKLSYDLSLFFVNHLTTSRRLWASMPAPPIDTLQDGPYHPSHFLLESDEREKIFTKYFRLAFNKDIIVKRGLSAKVTLHVGDAPVVSSNEDRVAPSYLKRLIELPTLDKQGDGMRGFVGVMLSCFVSIQTLLMIDEPETFLHPPQARMLGRMLGKEIPSDKQIIIATHSEDILKGLIDSGSSRLKIIRLERKNNINYVTTLEHEDIKTVWSDPILRYSNILSGLFHSKVILCEGDADCRFYSAINDSLMEANHNSVAHYSSDLLFVHCGGKDKMHIVVKALKKLGVPVSVAADIDVLRDERNLKNLVQSLNGIWEHIKSDYDIFKSSMDKQKSDMPIAVIKQKINDILNEDKEDTILNNSRIEAIQNVIKKSSPWESVKKAGKSILTRGQEYQAYERVISYLKDKGLFVVEVGELECFVKSVGNKGPKWVNQVLEQKDLSADPELDEAKAYVRQLVALNL